MTYSLKELREAFRLEPQQAKDSPNQLHAGGGILAYDANDRRLEAALRGENWHNNVLSLTASMVQKGVSDKVILTMARHLTLQGYTVQQTRSEMQVMINGARAKGFDQAHLVSKTAQFIPASVFAGRPMMPRTWLVPELIPGNTVTLLGGDGGTGKSLLAMQLAIAVALGKEWFGYTLEEGRALFLSAEDDEGELHRRAFAVSCYYGVELAELDRFLVKSLAGENALLATLERNGALVDTQLFLSVDEEMTRQRPDLLVLNTLADLFPGNENDRGQARQFIGKLRGLAIRHSCAVLLLAHPSLSGMTNGTGASGSTGWNNSVRSRLYLRRVINDQGEEDDADVRILATKKANYSKIGGENTMKWREGVFSPHDMMSSLDKVAAASKAEQVFLELLETFTAQGRKVNAAGGQNYAPKAFSDHPGSKAITKRAFRNAMESLLAKGLIEIKEDGPPSKRRSYLAIVECCSNPFPSPIPTGCQGAFQRPSNPLPPPVVSNPPIPLGVGTRAAGAARQPLGLGATGRAAL